MEKTGKVISVFKKKAVVMLDGSNALSKTTVCYNELGAEVLEGDTVSVIARQQVSNWKRWLLYASPALFLLVGFAIGFAFQDEFLKYALLLGTVGLSFLLIFIFKTKMESLDTYEYILYASSSLEERIKLAENEKIKREAEFLVKAELPKEKDKTDAEGQVSEEIAKEITENSPSDVLPKETSLAESGAGKEDLKGE